MCIPIRPEIIDLMPYEPGKPIDEVKRELGLDRVVKLASNENPWGASPKALAALKENTIELNRYPEGSCFYLNKALAKKLGVGEDNLIFGNGSDEIIEIIVKTYLGRDDEVIISEGAFIRFWMGAKLMGSKIVQTRMFDFSHNLEFIAEAITPQTRLVFIANPNNPTGTMNTKQEMDVFLEKLPPDVLVVIDEAYHGYITSNDYPQTLEYLKKGANIVILRTFSKIYGLAGLRLGYGIGKPEIIRDLNRVRPPFNVNSVAQAAGLAALEDDEWIRKCRDLNEEGKQYLYGGLDEMGLRYIPSMTNFILVDVKEDARLVFENLLKEGVIVRPMNGYGFNNFIRVTIGRPEENEEFIKALKKIKKKSTDLHR